MQFERQSEGDCTPSVERPELHCDVPDLVLLVPSIVICRDQEEQ